MRWLLILVFSFAVWFHTEDQKVKQHLAEVCLGLKMSL